MKALVYAARLAFLLFLTAATKNVQAQDTNTQIASIKKNLKNLSRKFSYSTDEKSISQAKVNKINYLSTETDNMLNYIKEKGITEFSAKDEFFDYYITSKYLLSLNNVDSVILILDYINFDIKENYIATGGTDTLIEVTIKVLDDSSKSELFGYYPYAKPSLSINPLDVEAFSPTNNAIKKLRPGKKTFWIKKDEVVKGEINNWGLSVTDEHTHLLIFYVKH